MIELNPEVDPLDVPTDPSPTIVTLEDFEVQQVAGDVRPSSKRRHNATKRAFAKVAKASDKYELDDAALVLQEHLSSEVLNAETEEDFEFVGSVIQRFMSECPDVQPTNIAATPKAFIAISDNDTAASYIEIMLSGDNPFDHWAPIIDWDALVEFGGVDKLQPGDAHNKDLQHMKQWAYRLNDYGIGQEIALALKQVDANLFESELKEFSAADAVSALQKQRWMRGMAERKWLEETADPNTNMVGYPYMGLGNFS